MIAIGTFFSSEDRDCSGKDKSLNRPLINMSFDLCLSGKGSMLIGINGLGTDTIERNRTPYKRSSLWIDNPEVSQTSRVTRVAFI